MAIKKNKSTTSKTSNDSKSSVHKESIIPPLDFSIFNVQDVFTSQMEYFRNRIRYSHKKIRKLLGQDLPKTSPITLEMAAELPADKQARFHNVFGYLKCLHENVLFFDAQRKQMVKTRQKILDVTLFSELISLLKALVFLPRPVETASKQTTPVAAEVNKSTEQLAQPLTAKQYDQCVQLANNIFSPTQCNIEACVGLLLGSHSKLDAGSASIDNAMTNLLVPLKEYVAKAKLEAALKQVQISVPVEQPVAPEEEKAPEAEKVSNKPAQNGEKRPRSRGPRRNRNPAGKENGEGAKNMPQKAVEGGNSRRGDKRGGGRRNAGPGGRKNPNTTNTNNNNNNNNSLGGRPPAQAPVQAP